MSRPVSVSRSSSSTVCCRTEHKGEMESGSSDRIRIEEARARRSRLERCFLFFNSVSKHDPELLTSFLSLGQLVLRPLCSVLRYLKVAVNLYVASDGIVKVTHGIVIPRSWSIEIQRVVRRWCRVRRPVR